jgi:hypothetical protein
MSDIILEGDHPRIISAKFGRDWLSGFRGEGFFKFHPPFSIFSLAAIFENVLGADPPELSEEVLNLIKIFSSKTTKPISTKL